RASPPSQPLASAAPRLLTPHLPDRIRRPARAPSSHPARLAYPSSGLTDRVTLPDGEATGFIHERNRPWNRPNPTAHVTAPVAEPPRRSQPGRSPCSGWP